MNVNLNPPPEREFPPARLERRKEQLISLIEAEKTRRPRRRLLQNSRRRPIAAIAVAAVTAGVVAATALLLTGNSSGPGSAQKYVQSPPRVSIGELGGRQLAAYVLLRAARTAAKQPAAKGPGPGQFFYTKSEGWQQSLEGRPTGVFPTYFKPFTREMWIGPDGSGRKHEVDGHALFPTAALAAYFNKELRNQPNILAAQTSDTTFKPGEIPYINLGDAPTDPAQLKKLVENLNAFPSPAQTFQSIGDLLRYYYAAPAVRSALYTIASQLPGVRLIGPTHDQLGRPGTGVAYYLPGPPHGPVFKDAIYELIFDPQTSALLAEQTVVVHRSDSTPFPPGTVTSWTSYLASGIVDSTTATTSGMP